MVAASIAAVCGGPSAAGAAPVSVTTAVTVGLPSARPALAIAPVSGRPGRRVAVVGRRFPRGARVIVRFGGRIVRRLRAGPRGGFRIAFRAPRRQSGRYAVTARSGRVVARRRFRLLLPRRGPPPPAPPVTPGPVPPPLPPTPTPPDTSRTLVAAGDIACIPGWVETPTECRHARTAALAQALAPDAVAALGDAQYQRGEFENYMGSYHPTWGALKGITRPATGNHEYLDDPDRLTAAGHFAYFGAAAGEPDEGYYGYELGAWRIFVLNTGALEWTRTGGGAALEDDCFPVSCAAGSEQEQWLHGELEALPDDACVLAYWHHPRYSSGWNGNPQPHPELSAVWQALQDHGAELVLTSHAHAYERFAPMDADGDLDAAGLRQFVVGTGGRSLFDDPGPQQPGSERLDTDSFGVLELELEPGGYDFRFVREDGAVMDSGSGDCQDRPA